MATVEEKKAAFVAQIEAFLASADEKLEFPATLSKAERVMIHDLAYERDLHKQSRGPKNGARYITVAKPSPEEKAAMV
eukprot:SAG11_NODE_35298_length_267_cov_0.619048_1_plen_77_part_10